MCGVVLNTGNGTDVGRERSENQDYFGAYDGSPHGDLWVICDGVGGAAGGRTASTMAVEAIRSTFQSGPHEDGISAILAAVAEANTAVYERAGEDRSLRGMATTAVMLVINHGRAAVAHVGDSRAYLIRDGQMIQLTKDHTLVQAMIDAGNITPDQAESHPESHVITRSVGSAEQVEVEIDAEDLAVQLGDRFVLCSDGLSGQVSDEIIQEVASELSPQRACRMLIKLANDAGGPDNITVQIIGVEEETSRLAALRLALRTRLKAARWWVWIIALVAALALAVGGGVWLADVMEGDGPDASAGEEAGSTGAESVDPSRVTQDGDEKGGKPSLSSEGGAQTNEEKEQP